MEDSRSWESIYAEHRVELLRYVHRLTRDVHLAEDVVQDAFLRLWRETRTVDNPRSWLYRVCTNMVRDRPVAPQRASGMHRMAMTLPRHRRRKRWSVPSRCVPCAWRWSD